MPSEIEQTRGYDTSYVGQEYETDENEYEYEYEHEHDRTSEDINETSADDFEYDYTPTSTKMFTVTVDTTGVSTGEAKEWVKDLANVNADMETSDLSVSRNKIRFRVGFSGRSDTTADDISSKIEEYITIHEAFEVTKISVS
jgi:hypothetical protein